jgi:uncharacterized protein (DUF885 family)
MPTADECPVTAPRSSVSEPVRAGARLACVALTALVAACAARKPEAAQGTSAVAPEAVAPEKEASAAALDPAARVLSLADQILLEQLDENPGAAASLRLPGTRYDVMPDVSSKGVRAREEKRAAILAALEKIDGAPLDGTVAGLTREVAVSHLQGVLGVRVCKNELWSLSTQGGFVVMVARLGEVQPVGTPELRAQALTRWGLLAGYLDQSVSTLREGLQAGYVAPAPVVAAVQEQLDKLLASPVKESPLMLPAKRDSDPAFGAALEQLTTTQVLPALARARDFIARELRPKARESVGVSAMPRGAECYRASLLNALTTERTPEQIHQLGKTQLEKLEAEMTALSARSFGSRPLPELHAWFRDDPSWHYRDREEMLEQARAALARARRVLPQAFSLLPKADVVIEPIPEFQEKSTAPHYQAPAQDGSRPAQYRIRLYQAEQQSRSKGEDTAFHETIPGHHLERGLAAERTDLPRFLRYVGSGAFSEGWGLYAERLADELGLYSGDSDRFGMLDGHAWRALRLIVDSGLHELGWTRQQAIDLLLSHSSLSRDFAASEVDRYISWPGQASSYMVGYLEIAALREQAKAELGPRFDLRTFHARVLENGSVPLTVLRRQIERWLAEEKRAR